MSVPCAIFIYLNFQCNWASCTLPGNPESSLNASPSDTYLVPPLASSRSLLFSPEALPSRPICNRSLINHSGILLHLIQNSYHYLTRCCSFVCWLCVSPGMYGLQKGRDLHLHCGVFSLWTHGCSVDICSVTKWPLAMAHPLLYGPVDLSDLSSGHSPSHGRPATLAFL